MCVCVCVCACVCVDLCYCGQIAIALHYFFNYPLYTILRNDLELETGSVPIFTLKIILNEDATPSEQRNLELRTVVSKYFSENNRF